MDEGGVMDALSNEHTLNSHLWRSWKVDTHSTNDKGHLHTEGFVPYLEVVPFIGIVF